MNRIVADAVAMERLGAQLAHAWADGGWIHLSGELGAGKTTLVRGFLHALGHDGRVQSPTYTLIEPYELQGRTVLHVDLYRIADPREFDTLGLWDALGDAGLCLVEWPERATGCLPPADLALTIAHGDRGARRVRLTAESSKGRAVLAGLGSA